MEKAKFIEISAGVRYWEDATLNGKEDSDGQIPLRNGDLWEPLIELDTGRIIGWPEGNFARIHYKVCDEGEYWLLDEAKQRIAKWKDYYVPNNILCVGDNGFGDYIIFRVGADGVVVDWKNPTLFAQDWDPIA